MNILWLSHFVPYPPKGGNLQRSFNLIKELSKHHKVYLLSFNQAALIPDELTLADYIKTLENYCTIIDILPIQSEQPLLGRIPVYLKSLFSKQPFTINWLKDNKLDSIINDAATRYDIDLIHFDTISLTPYVKDRNVVNVLNHHNIESHMMLRRANIENNFLKKMYLWQEGVKLRYYEKNNLNKFNAHLTCSTLDSDRLREISNKLEIVEIPNGVDLSYFQPHRIDVATKDIIFVGGLSWYPNLLSVEFLIHEVWDKLKFKIQGVQLTIVGRNPPKWLTDLADTDSSLTVTGFVDDMRPYVNKSTVFVCPIFDGGGTKLKVLDALAMGIPLIAHPAACEGINVTDGQNVLYAEEPEEYISQIERLFNSRELQSNMSKSGRDVIEKTYSFISIGRKLANYYDTLCEKVG